MSPETVKRVHKKKRKRVEVKYADADTESKNILRTLKMKGLTL